MLFRILGEVIVGMLVAGLLTAFVVPAAARLGYSTGPWMAVAISSVAVIAAVAVGERKHRRRKARESS